MSITMIGLDTAKSVFQVHGVNETGKAEIKRKLRRSELIPFFEKLETCTIVLEACGAAHHWARIVDFRSELGSPALCVLLLQGHAACRTRARRS